MNLSFSFLPLTPHQAQKQRYTEKHLCSSLNPGCIDIGYLLKIHESFPQVRGD
jgi:hypothetical protein